MRDDTSTVHSIRGLSRFPCERNKQTVFVLRSLTIHSNSHRPYGELDLRGKLEGTSLPEVAKLLHLTRQHKNSRKNRACSHSNLSCQARWHPFPRAILQGQSVHAHGVSVTDLGNNASAFRSNRILKGKTAQRRCKFQGGYCRNGILYGVS